MMRMKRITFKPDDLNFMVEEGEFIPGSLTAEEKQELKDLVDQLAPYGDFTAFKDLEAAEIRKVTQMKHRRGELEQKNTQPRLEFTPIPADEIISLIAVIQPNRLPIYVQNMPAEWLEKLFAQQLTLNIGTSVQQPVSPAATSETPEPDVYVYDPNKSTKHNKIIEVLHNVSLPSGKKAINMVEITPDANNPEFITILPTCWLGSDYTPLDKALKNQFGEGAAWISKGQGDKTAHWQIL